jgi:iron complex transport system substrate-binding protein
MGARVGRGPAARRPRVYYARGPRGLDTARPASISREKLERLGPHDVAAEFGSGGLARVSMEQVLARNPEVIVTIDANCFYAVWRDSLWQGLAAERRRP